MDSNVKSLIITGTAAEDATRFRQKGSRRKRVIKEDEPDTFIENLKQIVTVKPTQPQPQPHAQPQPQPQVKLQVKPPTVVQIQTPSLPQPQTVKPPEPNVILKPLKQPRVKLQPKATHTITPTDPITRKARRIHLTVGNLTHRFTRAKRLKDDTEKKPMSSIREYLVGKGVIQQKSKAPEKMLRSMYSDFMLLKDQAL